jgi:hypothetical protein
MMRLISDYSRLAESPETTLRLSFDEIESVVLSVSLREARNRSAFYQRKHVSPAAGMNTRDRAPELAALNRPISEHYRRLGSTVGSLHDRRVTAFPISDLTANPLRPHFDAEADRKTPGAGLFYLQDEPLGEVPYTLLVCRRTGSGVQFEIQHEVRVRPDGSVPPADLCRDLIYWIACPPLLRAGEHDLERYAVLDYDVRHVFGFPHSFAESGHASAEQQTRYLAEFYAAFPKWKEWSALISERLGTAKPLETGYHAALGLSASEMILIHRIASIPELAAELQRLGASDAVLLDSGGSCAIWANWLNGNQGGVFANHYNYREARGAVMFLILKGSRGLPDKHRDPIR